MFNKKSNLNIANLLSLSRIIVPIPLIYCLELMHAENIYKLYSILIILYIFISDILDGYFARKLNHVTELGKIIDPIADKICLIVVLIYLIDVYQTSFLIFFILISFRDIMLLTFTLYLIRNYNYVAEANFYGKIFIFITTIMLISFIFKLDIIVSNIMYYSSLVMLFLSTYHYVKSHMNKIKEYESI